MIKFIETFAQLVRPVKTTQISQVSSLNLFTTYVMQRSLIVFLFFTLTFANQSRGGTTDLIFVNSFETLACSSVGTTLISGMAVIHQDGQSYVTWHDREEAESGADFRYDVYWSNEPIQNEEDVIASIQVGYQILNNSGQLFGAFGDTGIFVPASVQRLDPTIPMAIIQEGGEPLPLWSGLWVIQPPISGCSFYAVIATDGNDIQEDVQPGLNATIEPVLAVSAPRQPVKIIDGADRPTFPAQTLVTGTPDLPLFVKLHGSGGRVSDWGDLYSFFADEDMGYQAGMPGTFAVQETHSGPQFLQMTSYDSFITPSGSRRETWWTGYVSDPPDGRGRHFYPFTTERLLWMIPWVIDKYNVDPDRVYIGGGSMGAHGSQLLGLRHPEIFAAIYPDRGRYNILRPTTSFAIGTPAFEDQETFPDGNIMEEDPRVNSIIFVNNHHEDLPFIGFNSGRNDPLMPWAHQIAMVQALTTSRHGFAFAWNNGDHSGGSASRLDILQWYPQEKFARNLSYPAFSNSSIDGDMGTSSPDDFFAVGGDLEGGINLGFDWTDPTDTNNQWLSEISNALATAQMTVDVTPRRAQNFRPSIGTNINYEIIKQSGVIFESGTVIVDEYGLATIVLVPIYPGESTRVRLFIN